MAVDPPQGPAVYRIVLHGLWALIASHRDDLPAAEAQLTALGDTPIRPSADLGHWEYLVMARAVLAEWRGRPEEALVQLRSNPDIAAEFLLSRRTIETHASHILAKLGARSSADIARQAAAQAACASSA